MPICKTLKLTKAVSKPWFDTPSRPDMRAKNGHRRMYSPSTSRAHNQRGRSVRGGWLPRGDRGMRRPYHRNQSQMIECEKMVTVILQKIEAEKGECVIIVPLRKAQTRLHHPLLKHKTHLILKNKRTVLLPLVTIL